MPVETWVDGRLVAFDVESTGVDPEEDRIVTAAVVMCGGGESPEQREWLVNPGVEIPEGATAVHGITTEQARGGADPAEVLAELVSLLACRPDGSPIVAFNARFDLTMLDREARRYGITPLSDRGALHVVDPLVIDKHLDRYRRGSRKLGAICAAYGATLDDAHDAGSDALAAARAAWVLGKRGVVVRRVRNTDERREKAALVREWEYVRGDLAELHDAQTRWAREQAVSLADYFRGQGKDEEADGVQPDWPVVPGTVSA